MTNTETVAPTCEPCWICGLREEHAPTGHVYTTEREAAEWYARQPAGVPVIPVVDGVVYTYGA